ncbi:Uridine 5'-monophosphate synthase [Chionoecetes opilio]|uniref:Uridine 5'-monophosphate synthase n=1 Tax=Chionoecetes opilio TaxID=41210 RepID=A0A8J5D0P4_CHIOP|nr:Uridine 5'-monophosphate synthase [Chionoecetes opilio]
MSEDRLEQCVLDLHRIGVVKFGSFTLKSGMQSPVYFDLRTIVSHPKILETVAELLWAARPDTRHDLVCGVAYTGLPIATVMSLKQNLPMLIRRKETKSYGTKKLVEGEYREGQRCLVVEDVIVSGGSVYETVETLVQLGLEVKDAVVFLDRQHGGAANLTALGINVVSVLDMTKLMSILVKHDRITPETDALVREFVATHNTTTIATKTSDKPASDQKHLTFESRLAAAAAQPVAHALLALMASKKTNLCVAADVTTSRELLSLADQVGPHICLLKTHVDILEDFTPDTVDKLKTLAEKHNFLLFEDRKFGDIGSTVARQYGGGLYATAEWAHLVTAHGLPGDGVIKGLMSAAGGRLRGCILVAQMSSEGALTSQGYAEGCIRMAASHRSFVAGFVSQSRVTSDPGFILMTPGVQINKTGDDLGQQASYVSPRAAVLERGADVIIVGRGVTKAEDPAAAAQTYKEEAYAAYTERITQT